SWSEGEHAVNTLVFFLAPHVAVDQASHHQDLKLMKDGSSMLYLPRRRMRSSLHPSISLIVRLWNKDTNGFQEIRPWVSMVYRRRPSEVNWRITFPNSLKNFTRGHTVPLPRKKS